MSGKEEDRKREERIFNARRHLRKVEKGVEDMDTGQQLLGRELWAEMDTYNPTDTQRINEVRRSRKNREQSRSTIKNKRKDLKYLEEKAKNPELFGASPQALIEEGRKSGNIKERIRARRIARSVSLGKGLPPPRTSKDTDAGKNYWRRLINRGIESRSGGVPIGAVGTWRTRPRDALGRFTGPPRDRIVTYKTNIARGGVPPGGYFD